MNYDGLRAYLEGQRPDVVSVSCMTFLPVDALKVARLAKAVVKSVLEKGRT